MRPSQVQTLLSAPDFMSKKKKLLFIVSVLFLNIITIPFSIDLVVTMGEPIMGILLWASCEVLIWSSVIGIVRNS